MLNKNNYTVTFESDWPFYYFSFISNRTFTVTVDDSPSFFMI